MVADPNKTVESSRSSWSLTLGTWMVATTMGRVLVRSVSDPCWRLLSGADTTALLQHTIANYTLTDEIWMILKMNANEYRMLFNVKMNLDDETGDEEPVDGVTKGFPSIDLYPSAFFRLFLMGQDE